MKRKYSPDHADVLEFDTRYQRQKGGFGRSTPVAANKLAAWNSSELAPVPQRVSNLFKALGDVLEAEDLDEMLENIGEECLHRALDLQTCLQKHAPKVEAAKPILAASLPHNRNNHPSLVSALTVTPWLVSGIPRDTPMLPQVLDRTLEVAAFTHVGCGTGRISDLSYERLEWVGDAYIYLTSTLLISQTFASLLPGKCSQMRERLLKNVTLSGYARLYGFDQRAILPKDIFSSAYPLKDKDMTKILGDIFEAYVAAVILSDPNNGVNRAYTWLKALWSVTLAKDLREAECRAKIDNPMWRLRGDVEKVEMTVAPAADIVGSKEQLKRLIGAKCAKLTYKDAGPEKRDKETGMPIFTVGVFLNGWGEKDRKLGYGSALGKKEAGDKAAEMAMANKKLMKIYVDRKMLYDTQMKAEQEALQKQKSK